MYVFKSNGRGEAQDDDALEEFAGGFGLGATEDDDIVFRVEAVRVSSGSVSRVRPNVPDLEEGNVVFSADVKEVEAGHHVG